MGIEKIFHLKAPWDRLARLAFIALAYFVAARLGLLFVVQPENFAGIWPASGVALAALLLSPWTERFAVLVVIFAVNALSNLTTGNSLAVSAGFALANTLEPALGSWLLVRYAGRRITFTRLKDLTGLLGVVIFANAITALIGAVVPALSFNTLYWSSWTIWYIEDGLGILILTPLIVTWWQSTDFRKPLRFRRGLEAVVLLVVLVASLWASFGEPKLFGAYSLRPYLLFPILAWAALRFSPRGVSTVVAVIAIFSVGATVAGMGNFPLGGDTPTGHLVNVQAFCAVASITAMLLSVILAERRQASESLHENEEILATAEHVARTGSWKWDLRTQKVAWSEGMFHLFGVDPAGFDGDVIAITEARIHPEDKPAVRQANTDILQKAHPTPMEYRILLPDGTVRHVWAEGRLTHDKNGTPVAITGYAQDITERKQAEEALHESEERFRTLFEQAAVGVALLEIKTGRYKDINQKYCDFLGYTREEMLNFTFQDVTYPDDVNENSENNASLLAGKIREFSIEKRYIRKDGSIVWGHLTASRLWAPGEVPAVYLHIAVVQDITERKQAEQQLKDALAQKETLLRELYHRTKNNMQVIIALLEMHGATETDPHIQQVFLETTNRILAMTLVHQKLHESQNLTSIDLGEYLSDLVLILGRNYRVNTDLITFDIQVEEIPVLIDTATPCGLLVNEILSNTFKYAFPQGRKGEIKVRLSRGEGKAILLEIADNGVGIPPEVDIYKSPTLGLQLITGIAKSQLGGQVTLENKAGACWRIQFSDDQYRPRV
jgi:PAS domain S-box-containing protein